MQPINALTTSGSVNAMRDNGDHIACAEVALLAVWTPIFMYKRSARDADGRNKRFRKIVSLIFFYKIVASFSLSISYYARAAKIRWFNHKTTCPHDLDDNQTSFGMTTNRCLKYTIYNVGIPGPKSIFVFTDDNIQWYQRKIENRLRRLRDRKMRVVISDRWGFEVKNQ